MNLYAYAGNNPVAFADPFGLCPNKTKGRICIAFFIKTKTAAGGLLKGDGRDFSTYSIPTQSRAYAIIDPNNETVRTVVNQSCWGDGSGCAPSINSAGDFTVTRNENGGYQLHVDIMNSKILGPSINAEITIDPDGKGGYKASGLRDGYPWAEGYYYREDGTIDVLFKKPGTSEGALLPPMEERVDD